MKKIKLFLDPILFVMEDESGLGGSHYIDLQTGDIVSPDLEDDVSYEDVEDEERYFCIEPVDSHEGYEIMEDFVGTIELEEIRDRLSEVLDRPKPFRNFKEALYDYTEIQKGFYEYKENRLKEILKEQLSEIGYEIEEDLPTRIEKEYP